MFVVYGLLFIVRLVFGVGCIVALKYFIIVCNTFLFQSEHKHSKIIFNLQMLLCRLCLWFGVWRLVLLDISPLCVFAPLRALRETRQKFKSLGWFKGLIVVQKVQDKVFSNY
jgi:hypothetical protein